MEGNQIPIRGEHENGAKIVFFRNKTKIFHRKFNLCVRNLENLVFPYIFASKKKKNKGLRKLPVKSRLTNLVHFCRKLDKNFEIGAKWAIFAPDNN